MAAKNGSSSTRFIPSGTSRWSDKGTSKMTPAQVCEFKEALNYVSILTSVGAVRPVVPENSIRRDSRGEVESEHHPTRCLRSSALCLSETRYSLRNDANRLMLFLDD